MASTGLAANITFDDLPTNAFCYGGGQNVPDGYGGLNWNNFDYIDATVPSCSVEGYGTAMASSPNVGYDGSGDPASITSATPFTLVSAEFAAAWVDDLTLCVTAMSGATTVGTVDFTLNTSTKVLETFNFGPVTELDFSSSGGTENPNLAQFGDGTQFAVDNISVNTPEPSAFSMLVGAAGLAAAASILKSARQRLSTNV